MTPLDLEAALAPDGTTYYAEEFVEEGEVEDDESPDDAVSLHLFLHPGEAAVLAQITGLGMAMMSGDQPTAQALHNLLRDPRVIPVAISAYRKVVGLLVDEQQWEQVVEEAATEDPSA